MIVIYKITNLVNNKIYIGKHITDNVNDTYLGSGVAIKNAIKKYGKENFIKEILYIYDNEACALEKERELVDQDFVNNPMTYNMTLGGFGSWFHRKGLPLSQEHKDKISILLKNRIFSDETKNKISKSLLGRSISDKTRLKISQSKIGIKRSEDSKVKQSKSVTGLNNPFYGKKHSAETRSKIANREYSQKISISINGREFDCLKSAAIEFSLGVNYLSGVLKEMRQKNMLKINKYHKTLKINLLIEVIHPNGARCK